MADIIQIRDYDRRAVERPDCSAEVIRLPQTLGTRARKLREQFNKAKPVVVK